MGSVNAVPGKAPACFLDSPPTSTTRPPIRITNPPSPPRKAPCSCRLGPSSPNNLRHESRHPATTDRWTLNSASAASTNPARFSAASP
ncbi:MAG: hypothetical protein ACK462_04035, partial [Planctomyces sp.]